MAFRQVMAELESLADEQTAEMLRRRGAGDNLYGVPLAEVHRIAGTIGQDHDLALRLWATRIVDAQLLAVLVVDPGKLSAEQLDEWVSEARFEELADLMVRHVVARSPFARGLMTRWIAHREPLVQRCGFAALGHLAQDDASVDEELLEEKLRAIETHVGNVTHRAKDAMGSALLTIAQRNERLNELVLRVAKRLGPIELDAGDRGHTPEDLLELLKGSGPSPKQD